MHFQILNTVTKQYIGNSDGPCRYDDGDTAAWWARRYTYELGQKCQPRRIEESIDWRAREQSRFRDGTYVRVPWQDYHWFQAHMNPDHFVHLSLEEPGKVAFTENEEKGIADRQTRMRGGAYLKKFFADHLTHERITELATTLASEVEANEVKFAHSEDDIERVYRNGPTSCMSHGLEDYSSSIHPVRVYAAGDCAVAYLERRNHVTARSVCWPEKKIYTRIYGDALRLEPLLRKLGYKSGDLSGARLLKVEEDGGYVCPYVDSCDGVTVEKDCLRLDDNGDYATDSTDGLIGEREPYAICSHCDGPIASEDDAYSVYIGRRQTRTWCESCRNNDAIYCESEEIDVTSSYTVAMADGTSWSEWKFEASGFVCDRNGRNYPDDECRDVTLKEGSTEHWSLDACASDAVQCWATDEWYALDAVVKLRNGHLVGYNTDEARDAIAAGEAELPDRADGFHVPTPTIPHENQLDLIQAAE